MSDEPRAISREDVNALPIRRWDGPVHLVSTAHDAAAALARIRDERWRVAHVHAYDTCAIVEAAGVGSDNRGTRGRFIVPFEEIEPIPEDAGTPRVVRPSVLRAAARSAIAAVTPAWPSLRAASGARIALLAYQLEPALALNRGLACRVLLADEVGLGKTIQAGLIVAETIARAADTRVLIVSPAGLREQWRSELQVRFGVAAAVLDAEGVARTSAQLVPDVNPWSIHPVAITSIDYVKRPEVLPALLQCHWDLIVVDEAHGATPESDRHRAVSSLTAHAPYVVLLTATPHNGDRAAFEALCALGQTKEADQLLFFRRRRIDIAPGHSRRVHRLDVRSSAAERRMYERLEQFSRVLERERQSDPAAALTLTMLHKRALSSARSLEASVRRRLAVLESPRSDQLFQPAEPLDDGAGEHSPADEAPGWAWPSLENAERERRLLETLAEAAQQAAVHETKLARLRTLLASLGARNESAIVFTEYRDTLFHVQRALNVRCALIHGGLSRAERRTALEEFQQGRRTVLLATDAAGEGLNLHHTCRVVINLELPWNPMRLEQRIGRVDRIGQRRRVHAFNLIAVEVGEQRLFERLAGRIASARSVMSAGNPLCAESRDRVERLSATETAAKHLPTEVAPLVRFEADAEKERRRLLEARRPCSDGRVPLASEMFTATMARARKPATRAQLRGRILVVLRQVCEDMAAHIVAVRLIPLLVPRPDCLSSNPTLDVELMLRSLEPELQRFEDQEWLEQMAATIERFWDTRMSRESSIAAESGARRTSESQPGLFDRRVERVEAARLDADRDRTARLQRQRAVMLRRSTVVAGEIRAVLILAT